MNITVCIKQVPSTSEVKLDPITGNMIREGVDSKINPYDLFAIEESVLIKEETGATVNTLTMGPPQAEAILYESYALGVDHGYLITDRKCGGADVLATAKALSEGIKNIGNTDLIICGKQTTDGDTAQVGAEIAEFLGIPHTNNVLEIKEIKENSLICDVDMQTTIQTIEIEMPCLISMDSEINQPRLPSYKLMKQTKDRGVFRYGVSDFEDTDETKYGNLGSATDVIRMFPPSTDSSSETWTGQPDEMAKKMVQKIRDQKLV